MDTLRLAMEEKETSGICMKMEAKMFLYLVRGLVARGWGDPSLFCPTFK